MLFFCLTPNVGIAHCPTQLGCLRVPVCDWFPVSHIGWQRGCPRRWYLRWGTGGEEWTKDRKTWSQSWAAGRLVSKKPRRFSGVKLSPGDHGPGKAHSCTPLEHQPLSVLTSAPAPPTWLQDPAQSRKATSTQLLMSQYLLSLQANKAATCKERSWIDGI